jgi:hypothetical protein
MPVAKAAGESAGAGEAGCGRREHHSVWLRNEQAVDPHVGDIPDAVLTVATEIGVDESKLHEITGNEIQERGPAGDEGFV